MFKIIKNKNKNLCVAYRCPKNKTEKDRFCAKHSKKYQKYKNPYKYTFHQKKYRAKERGISWDLTLEEFIEFCEETNYMELKGKTGESASIDRKDPKIGYTRENVQILSLANNSKKMHEDNRVDEVTEDLPF